MNNKKWTHTLVIGLAILGIYYDAQQEWKFVRKYGWTPAAIWGLAHLIIEFGGLL